MTGVSPEPEITTRPSPGRWRVRWRRPPAKARKPVRHDATAGSQPSERARSLFGAPREPGLRVAARGGGRRSDRVAEDGHPGAGGAGSSSQMLTGPARPVECGDRRRGGIVDVDEARDALIGDQFARAGPVGHRPGRGVPGARSARTSRSAGHPFRQLGHRGLQLRHPGQARPQGHVLGRRIRAVVVAERDALGHDAAGSGGAAQRRPDCGCRPSAAGRWPRGPARRGRSVGAGPPRAGPPARPPSPPSRRRHRRRPGDPRGAQHRGAGRAAGQPDHPVTPPRGAAGRSAARPRRSLQRREHVS